MPGPFTSYVPPGVYTRTLFEPAVNTLIDSLRLPVFIGIGQETLLREDYELIRGSSAVADNLVTKEDVDNSWVVDDSNPADPVLGPNDGTLRTFQTAHYPIVTGDGTGTTSDTPTDVIVLVNDEQVTVGSVDGDLGLVTLQAFIQAGDEVRCTYYFNRTDTLTTDDVSDQADSSNTIFKVFNVPIVDGTNGGTTATSVNDVTVEVDGVEVTVTAIDGTAGEITVETAPSLGAVVLITYYFNTWQNTFDYLPDTGITEVIRTGLAPGDASYILDTDYVVRNDLIYWGASYRIDSLVHTSGAEFFDDTQISTTLVDTMVYLDETTAYVDPDSSVESRTIFRLTYVPTLGNGRDTTLGQDTFNAIANGRVDVITDRPDLIIAYVGQDVQDARQRSPVTVLEVDGANRLITLASPVQPNETVFATYWTNFLTDDVYTLEVVTEGASGTGTYTVESETRNDNLQQSLYISKTAISQTLNWGTGNEQLLGIFHDGSGIPIEEYIELTMATNAALGASLSTSVDGPWRIVTGSNDGLVINASPVTLTQSTPAVVTGTQTENFNVDGLSLALRIETDTASQIVTLTGTGQTAAQVAAQITGAVTGITAADDGGGQVELTSVNVGDEAEIIIGNGTANSVLGFTASTTTGADTPVATVASDITTALGPAITAAAVGNAVVITTTATGLSATLTMSAGTANDTLGFETGQTDGGEDAFTTYTVDSYSDSGYTTPTTDGSGTGASNTGTVGQTYIDEVTGLRISLLPPEDGPGYDDTGTVRFSVLNTFVTDSANPVYAILGTETKVSNTTSVPTGDSATLETFDNAGNQPAVGDVYYTTYRYAKTDYDAKVFTNLKDIVNEYGDISVENRLSLAMSLAIQNGALLVAGKQVPTDGTGTDATTADYIEAIDELRKPVERVYRPAVIVPVTTDQDVISFTKTHCIVQSSIRYRQERICFFGYEVGTDPVSAQVYAKNLLSNRMIAVYPDSAVIALTDELGVEQEQLVDGSFLAAAVAGSNVAPAYDVATPMTHRQIVGFKRLQRVMDEVEKNQTAMAGITVLEDLDPNIRVRQAFTTDMSSSLLREPTVTTTADFVQQAIRNALAQFIGVKFLGSVTSDIERVTKTALRGLQQAQIITRFSNVTATPDETDPTAVQVEAVYVPVFPLNYIVVTFNLRSR